MLIANLSNLCWTNSEARRNQSVFEHLLDTDRFEEGFFVQPPMVRNARAFQFSRPTDLEVVSRPRGPSRPVTVLQPVLTLPAGYPEVATRRAMVESAQKLVKEYFQNRPYLLWINSITHFQAQLAEQLMPEAAFRVFDSCGLMMMYERSGGEHIKQARAIVKRSDLVLCDSEQAMTQISHPVKHLLSDTAENKVRPPLDAPLDLPPLFPKPEGAVYIGFLGMLTEERTDSDLLHAIFLRFPDYQFIFVGSTNRASLLARMKSYPNFHHIHKIPEEHEGSIIQQFDVAIVPELENHYTRGTDGTRIFDYLACGTPVLSTTARDRNQFGDAIHVAHSVWEFSYQLERLVKTPKTDGGAATSLAGRDATGSPEPWKAGLGPLMEVLLKTAAK